MYHLIIREPRAGAMHEILNHHFKTAEEALETARKTTRLAGGCAWGLFGEGNRVDGWYFCAWPFFGDLIPPEGTDIIARGVELGILQ